MPSRSIQTMILAGVLAAMLPASLVLAAPPAAPALFLMEDAGRPCSAGTAFAPVPGARQFKIGEMGEALSYLYPAPEAEPVPLILYVHGRGVSAGKEPVKSLNSYVPELTDGRTLDGRKRRVLMFYWPGSAGGGPLGFPEKQARAAGPALLETVKTLQANKERLRGAKAVLLAHSMGGFGLEAMVSGGAPALDANLFDAVLLTAAANEAKSHAAWMKHLNFCPKERVYVTVNENDRIVLGSAGARTLDARLGKTIQVRGEGRLLGRLRARPVDLVPGVNYVVFENWPGLGHDIFTGAGQAGSPDAKEFFGAALGGRAYAAPASNPRVKVEERGGAKVIALERFK